MPAGYNIQWTDEMDDLIRLSHETFVSYTSLAQKWGIAHSSVVVRASKLGLCNKDFWTAEEIKILTENWNDKSALQISKMLTGRSRNAVIGKAGRMRLTPKMGWVKPAEDKPKKKRVRKSKPTPPRPVVENKPLAKTKPIGLMELRANTCRAPVGHDEKGVVIYCGCEVFPAKPFCPEHCRIFYERRAG